MIVSDSSRIILAPNGRPAFLEALENNWYEGSRWSPNRSWVWQPVQDAKKDLDRFTRYELSKHSRYLWKNSPLMRGIIERMVTLIVGAGPKPVFLCDDELGKDACKATWRRVSKSVSLGAPATFNQYTRAIKRADLLDGECFSIQTMDDELFENRLQGLESNMVTDGASDSYASSENRHGSADGIILNAQGTPVAYKVRDVDTPYSREFFIHHMSPLRLGQYRGEGVMASAINTARDIDDILALEKQAVKNASSKTEVIETQSGELNQEMIRTLRYGSQYPTTFNLPADTRAKDDYYAIQFGAKPVVLKNGDKYATLENNRAGKSWEGFMDFLANTVCLSSRFPASVILPVNIGGTDIRRDLEIAQRVVEMHQDDMVADLDRMLMWLMEPEFIDGPLRKWHGQVTVAWHFPQKVNVDRQTAQQDRQDVQSGLMSKTEYHGRYGDDGDDYERTVIEEVKRRKQRIEDAGFEDPMEFVQILSLDPKMFITRVNEDQNPDGSPAAPPAKGKPKSKKATAKK